MTSENEVRAVLEKLTTPPAAPGPQPLAAKRSRTLGLQAAGPAGSQPWMTAPTIQGFGVGEKETCGETGRDLALKIYVDKKLPESKLGQPVPKTLSLPDMKSVVTDVVEVGHLALQSNTQRIRPARPGFSVGRADDRPNTGTFGMVVRKRGRPSPYYLLSNSHAIAASGLASPGDIVIQPGAADKGTAQTDRIGILSEWVPFDFTPDSEQNTVDAAIALLDDDAATAAIALLGVPDGIATKVSRGMYVQKVGRTTNLSVARITDVDLVLNLAYPTASGPRPATLRDQVLVTFYSAPGDSGSPVLDMANNVVGLHVGGSDIVGFFCKIENILDRLGLEIVTRDTLETPTASS